MDVMDNKNLLIKTIDEDDPPIVYMPPAELDDVSKSNLNIPRAIITTEDDFNLNGFIFESDIKVEPSSILDCDHHDSRYDCAVDEVEKNYEDERCLKRVVIKIEKLSDATIEKYSKRSDNSSTRKFECDICGYASDKKYYVRKHMVTHIKEKEHFCADCPKKFSTIKYLENHRKLHGVEEYTCQICSKKYSYKGSLKYHLKKHLGDKKFECYSCPMKFLLAYQLKVHQRTHTGLRPYECKICGSKFGKLSTLLGHMHTHNDERPFICDYDQCSKAFKQKAGLRRHQRRHKTDRNTVACKDCPKKFFCSYRLSIHRRVHTGEKPYSCKFCSRSFAEKNVLDNHTRIHTKEKPFACSTCNKTFARLSTLIDHRRTHSDERRYGCDICSKRFKSKTLLRAHKIMHTAKQYSCNRCLITFREKKSWINHQREGTELQFFKCKYCNESTAWMCVLKEHMKTHIGEKRLSCNICSKNFSSNSLLNKHSKIHIAKNKRQHACNKCPKKFNTTASLNRHTLTHTGEKPFKCKECSLAFARLDSLKGHMKRRHFDSCKNELNLQQKSVQFECYICRFECTYKHRLEEHMKKHQESN